MDEKKDSWAFEKWWEEEFGESITIGHTGNYLSNREFFDLDNVWFSACAYKNKEITELKTKVESLESCIFDRNKLIELQLEDKNLLKKKLDEAKKHLKNVIDESSGGNDSANAYEFLKGLE